MGEGFGGSRLSQKKQYEWRKSIAGSGTRAEPLEAAGKALRQASQLLLWLADAICHCFLMLALSIAFFLSEPVAFRQVYSLESSRGLAGNRTTTGSLSATSRTPRY